MPPRIGTSWYKSEVTGSYKVQKLISHDQKGQGFFWSPVPTDWLTLTQPSLHTRYIPWDPTHTPKDPLVPRPTVGKKSQRRPLFEPRSLSPGLPRPNPSSNTNPPSNPLSASLGPPPSHSLSPSGFGSAPGCRGVPESHTPGKTPHLC